MTHFSGGSTSDPQLNDLEQRLRNCLTERINDWNHWQSKSDKLTQDLQIASTQRATLEAQVEALSRDKRNAEQEIVRLQGVEAQLRQAQAEVTRLQSQTNGLREEIERLLHEQDEMHADAFTVREQLQKLQAEHSALRDHYAEAVRQRDAFSEAERFQFEGLHQLLRARADLELKLPADLNQHLTQPAAIQLEILYQIVRLQSGIGFSELQPSDRLLQALEEQRQRGG